MGLGKTLQTVALLSSYSVLHPEARFLVLVPKVGTRGAPECASSDRSKPAGYLCGKAAHGLAAATLGLRWRKLLLLKVQGAVIWSSPLLTKVLLPASLQVVLHNWQAEFRKWLPRLEAGAAGLSVAKACTGASPSYCPSCQLLPPCDHAGLP
jgi:SNF2 family DNA or RNA helicase